MQAITDHQIIAPPANNNLMILTDGTLDGELKLKQIVTAVRGEDGVWTVTAAGVDDFRTADRGEAIQAMLYNAFMSLGPRDEAGRG
ncbi:hypothetical protein, partial [Mycobacterium sp. NS-7484]|uniref:hypothetical protein n=1 Tax=Mycobacterium sp. NS-7484 TaxID=1834161 RepID=UPI001153EF8B